MLLFLGIPAIAVAVGAFEKSSGSGFTMANVNQATTGVYLLGFKNSLKMALVTSVVPGFVGTFLAYAVHTSRGGMLRRVVVTASGVFANFGGIPLAFLFIASIGAEHALVTNWIADVGVHIWPRFDLYTFSGVALVYMYFQVPLMVLVTLPAFEGLKAPGTRRPRTWAPIRGSTGVTSAYPCSCRRSSALPCCCSVAPCRLTPPPTP